MKHLGVEMQEATVGLDELYSSAETFRARAYERHGMDRVGEHLAVTYGIDVGVTSELDGGVVRVDVTGGAPVVARVFSRFRPIEAVELDAAVLRFVEGHGLPAERCVAEPVSTFEGQPVLTTTFVSGTNLRPDLSEDTFHRLGALLGELHALPDPEQWPAAGSWHSLSISGGTRADDVARLRSLLADVATTAAADEREALGALETELWSLDAGDGLPQALTHPDWCPANAMRTPEGELVVVDWTGAGRAPRLQSLGLLLWATGGRPALIDAVAAGYRATITPDADELERLPDAIRGFGFLLSCWGIVYWNAPATQLVQGLEANRALLGPVVAKARAALTA